MLNQIALDLRNVNATYKSIANKYGISTTLAQLYADSFIHAPRMTLPVNLGIDEIHSSMAKYGGSYLCVFVDNQGRQLNNILPDRSKRTLARFFESIPQTERDKVRYVTIDMWQPYADTARKYLRNSRISVDLFHVIKHLTDSFERLRIDMMNKAVYNSPAYYLLKHWSKLLLSDQYYDKLDNEPKYNSYFRRKLNHRDLYDMLLGLNPDLALAYQLKEAYRDFNAKCTFEEAPERLDQIIES